MNNKERSHFSTKTAIEWYLDVGWHYGSMQESDARQIARVNRTTFDRWMRGESSAPEATLELLRMHAFGEPPGGFGNKDWSGFRFVRGLLVTDWGDDLTPGDLRNYRLYKSFFHREHDPVKIASSDPEIFFGQPLGLASR
jgi:hypothetical protein